jgi:hypothetical protein
LGRKNFQQGTDGGGSHCILRHLSQHDHRTLHSNWWGSGPMGSQTLSTIITCSKGFTPQTLKHFSMLLSYYCMVASGLCKRRMIKITGHKTSTHSDIGSDSTATYQFKNSIKYYELCKCSNTKFLLLYHSNSEKAFLPAFKQKIFTVLLLLLLLLRIRLGTTTYV